MNINEYLLTQDLSENGQLKLIQQFHRLNPDQNFLQNISLDLYQQVKTEHFEQQYLENNINFRISFKTVKEQPWLPLLHFCKYLLRTIVQYNMQTNKTWATEIPA